MSKDINGENTSDTYVEVKVSNNTVQVLTEYYPDTIESVTDSAGDIRFTMRGVPVTLPFLFNYDKTNTSPRVNETVQIL
jgi:hypothetical protein